MCIQTDLQTRDGNQIDVTRCVVMKMSVSEVTEAVPSLVFEVGLCTSGMVGLAPKWVGLAPNWTNPGFLQIRFQCVWRPCAKCTEI